MERIDLKTGFLCNNDCKMCVQAHKKQFGNKSTEQLKQYLREAVIKYKGVVFTGGEATIRKDVLDLVSYAKKAGYSLIQIQSNGRMFAYRDFCLRMIDAGANEFAIAIHGHIAELHDHLTGSVGSFGQTLQGIKNLLSLNQRVLTNTVITKPNYRHLPEIAKLLVGLGVRQFQFAFVHILGNAGKNIDSIVPRKSLVAPYVKKALDIGISSNVRPITEAIPYCFMRGYERCISEKTIPRTKVYDLDYIIEDFTEVRQKEGKIKGPACKGCHYYKICEGPWKEYPEHFGWEEFKPVNANFKKDSKQSRLLRAMEDIFGLLIENSKLNTHRQVIHQMRKILFSGFDSSWLFKNQKFDFSFSAPESKNEVPSFRFSFSDFGEKEMFCEKLSKIFGLFDGVYDEQCLTNILKAIGEYGSLHQTTFGLEWEPDKPYPRIKIYFEELFNVYSPGLTRELSEKLVAILGLKDTKPYFENKDVVAALCVDFLPHKKKILKSYLLINEGFKRIESIFKQNSFHFNKKTWDYFKKIGETKQFYYLTKRFDENGLLSSLKVYMIYESGSGGQGREPQAFKKLNTFLNSCGMPDSLFLFRSELIKMGFKVKPVIIAVDFNKHRQCKIDSYLTFSFDN